jgi:RNA polymerase sigma factor for flagellar operon FliA
MRSLPHAIPRRQAQNAPGRDLDYPYPLTAIQGMNMRNATATSNRRESAAPCVVAEAATVKPSLDKQVVAYTPLVKRTAHHLMVNLPSSVRIDDLIQAGMIGLLEALDRYDASHGAQFETYAAQRIRGAMLDELRQNDAMPRSARRGMRHIEKAVAQLQQQLGRAPGEREIAKALNVPLEEYQQMLQDAHGYQVIFYEDFEDGEDNAFLEMNCGESASPLEALADQNLRTALIAAIEHLPEREKLLMSLYYEQELNYREIGAVLGITESRVCQLHRQATTRLRAQLKDY